MFAIITALRKSAWVFNHNQVGDSQELHEEMVDQFCIARLEAGAMPLGGVKGEIQRLLEYTHRLMLAKSSKIIRSNREEYEKLLRF